MDPVTHAASGAVAMLALPGRPATRWAVPLAALVAASPDLDILFASGPLQFLLLHRGITHSLAALPVMGLILAVCSWPLWRAATPARWSFARVWLLACALVLLHIWLDVVTTYGTMIFLPFSHERVRLNGIFIIDLLLTLPLLWAVWRWRTKRALMLLALAWIFVYPALGVGLNAWHTAQTEARLAAEHRLVSRVTVLPDALAPFFWRVLFEEENAKGKNVREQGLNALGQARTPERACTAVPNALAADLSRQSVTCETFLQFAVLPVIAPLRREEWPQDPAQHAREFLIHDLRFGSNLEFVQKLMAMRPHADIPFQLMVEVELGQGDSPDLRPKNAPQAAGSGARLLRERLRFSDSGRDSRWGTPRPPRPPSFWPWLVGLR
ncbi:metal-dependent hydrolase [Desulfovibrio sp. ZJ369]|uniref:metal-dependent hydrolase n=1 Tax=Desulfovibrio sp. ZJ369 TaxID=2709793 RepID=UPI0013EAA02D|nr:metal-dependent hydrolase [Desulfovibrio sp. ZJ369]